jgi:hypothetical protein
MKKFCVLQYGPSTNYRAVKVGFSWPGFFFVNLWVLYHKLWLHFIGIAVVNLIICLILESAVDPRLDLLVQLAMMFFIGYHGNRWVINKWLRKGYEVKGIVFALSKEQAIARVIQAEKTGESIQTNQLLEQLVGKGI